MVLSESKLAAPIPGVLRHQRETVSRNSVHVYIGRDGRAIDSHFDRYNPDAGIGNAWLHFCVDYAPGTVMVLGAAAFVFGLILIRGSK